MRASEPFPLSSPPSLLVGGWLAQLLPFAVLGAMGWVLADRWESIPERFVVHWDGRFQPDRWAEKDPLAVALPLLIGAMLCSLMLALTAWLERSDRWAAPAPGDAAQLPRRRRAIGWVLLGSNLFLALVMAAVAASPLIQSPREARLFVVALVAGSILVPLILLVIWFLIFGKYFFSPRPAANDPRRENRYWKGGLIYYNPRDPALWVEKRVGIGYTLNMARPAAWGFLALVLLLPVAVTLLAVVLS